VHVNRGDESFVQLYIFIIIRTKNSSKTGENVCNEHVIIEHDDNPKWFVRFKQYYS